jgi:hypothetical protein
VFDGSISYLCLLAIRILIFIQSIDRRLKDGFGWMAVLLLSLWFFLLPVMIFGQSFPDGLIGIVMQRYSISSLLLTTVFGKGSFRQMIGYLSNRPSRCFGWFD